MDLCANNASLQPRSSMPHIARIRRRHGHPPPRFRPTPSSTPPPDDPELYTRPIGRPWCRNRDPKPPAPTRHIAERRLTAAHLQIQIISDNGREPHQRRTGQHDHHITMGRRERPNGKQSRSPAGQASASIDHCHFQPPLTGSSPHGPVERPLCTTYPPEPYHSIRGLSALPTETDCGRESEQRTPTPRYKQTHHRRPQSTTGRGPRLA